MFTTSDVCGGLRLRPFLCYLCLHEFNICNRLGFVVHSKLALLFSRVDDLLTHLTMED
ncbi:MAG: hypothetical protein KME55_23870 [Nostoc indistinguendum CM1-VF10]|nr:hypothetical protein [Nostoc indistinguendum CM1-VF10]